MYSSKKYSQSKMDLWKEGLLICINSLAKKSKLKHSGTETDVQPIYADKNSSLACLSLTDEGSTFFKEAKLAQVEQSQITIIHWFRVQLNFPNFKRKEKLNTLKNQMCNLKIL